MYLNLYDMNVNVCDGNKNGGSSDMMAAKEQSQSVIKVASAKSFDVNWCVCIRGQIAYGDRGYMISAGIS